MESLSDRFHRRAHLYDIQEIAPIHDRHGDQPQWRLIGILGRLKNALSGKRGIEGGPAERNFMLFDVGRSDRYRARWAEDLEELIDARQFGKLGEQFLFIDQREKPTLFERAHSRSR